MASNTPKLTDLHVQDWMIIIEALASWAGTPNTPENSREERAWELIEIIAEEQGMRPSRMIRQIDDDWPENH